MTDAALRFKVLSVERAPPHRHALAKARRFSMNHERGTVKKNEIKLRKTLRAFFQREAARIAAQFRSAAIEKAEGGEDDEVPANPLLIETVLAGISLRNWQADLPEMVEPYLTAVAIDAADLVTSQLGLFDKEVIDAMRTRAKAWAERRAAELVGMKLVAGVLYPNPDAKWQITETTREAIARNVRAGLREGMSVDRLAQAIEESAAFSPERAIMVARTEMALADTAGTLEGFRASPDVVGKRWLTAQDDKVSEECLESEAAGAIGLEDAFPPNGELAPPNHPNCRCALVPVFENEM